MIMFKFNVQQYIMIVFKINFFKQYLDFSFSFLKN